MPEAFGFQHSTRIANTETPSICEAVLIGTNKGTAGKDGTAVAIESLLRNKDCCFDALMTEFSVYENPVGWVR